MNKERTQALLDGFTGKRVIVIGDVMLDEYIWGQVSRISPEAPVMVVDAERYSQVPGGAANVVNNLCALGATGIMFGTVGDDDAGRALTEALQAEGAEVAGLLALRDRPTTRKTRIIAHSQQVVRVDHETRIPLPAESARRLIELLEEWMPQADAVLLSDYQKGVLAPDVLRECIRLAKLHQKPLTGNLKPGSLSGSCPLTVLTLNLSEASQALGGMGLESDEKVQQAGMALLEKTGAENILITRGAGGLTLFSATAPVHHVPARPVAVYDVAGAGDTVISAMTLALAAGATPLEAVTLANYAAAEAVKKVGVATVSRTEILAAVADAN